MWKCVKVLAPPVLLLSSSILPYVFIFILYLADGAEEQRRVEQLEILYRASGRKIEELTHEMEEKEEEKNKEIRSLKHKLAIANG